MIQIPKAAAFTLAKYFVHDLQSKADVVFSVSLMTHLSLPNTVCRDSDLLALYKRLRRHSHAHAARGSCAQPSISCT